MSDISSGWLITIGVAVLALGGTVYYITKHEGECPECGTKMEHSVPQENTFGYIYTRRCPQCRCEKKQFVPHESGNLHSL